MEKILRLPAVLERVGLSRSSIYARIKIGDFPAPVRLGVHAVGWLESAVDEWVRSLNQQSALPTKEK